MKLSLFGEKLTNGSGIVDLMNDLGSALNENPNMIFMGGGNPARIPQMEAVFKTQYKKLIESSEQLYSTTGVYQSPQGEQGFRREIAAMLNKQFDWPLTEENIAVSNGSQSAFYILFNLLAGQMPDGSFKSIHLPLTPEYIGYNDLGLSDNFFTGSKPEIELIGDDQFKYHVNFDDLRVGEDTAALCVSRPTNPTANMLTDDEIKHLDSIANKADIPLIIDGAYGVPFPNINFVDVELHWNNNTILVLSLSKLGLPGVRTGIVIASKEITQAFSNANTVINLASGNIGPSLTRDLFASNKIDTISNGFRSAYVLDHLKTNLSFSINHNLTEKLKLDWKISYQERVGDYFDAELELNKSYEPFWLTSLRFTQSINSYFNVFIDVNNLFDISYSDFGNIEQAGRWARIGLKAKI